MKKNRSNIILILIFLVGLSVMLYPTVSDYVNQKNQSRAVASYSEEVENLSDVDYQAYFDAADDYNRRLAETPDAFYRPEEVSGYTDTLDVSGTGIMGYITIPKIGVELPVYHGTSDGVLQVAAGHLEGSSLPVGGAGTHAVISAHRGLPSAKLFTNLDELEVGDTFTITVLDRVLTYEVDQISIVLPTETDLLQPVEGKDYVTLMTCTPYGINTHRLLVRGKRIENAENQKHIRVTADALRIEPIIVAPALAVPMLLVMLVVMLAVPHLRKRKNQREENHHEEHP
ncbi:class C sortase [Faecalibacterium hattorii]|mgnify:FL=1|uniref:class C sortase n=1 Tax=Faecalibacterium hattorii TaxID=2935520 RepID=UPI003AAD0EAB